MYDPRGWDKESNEKEKIRNFSPKKRERFKGRAVYKLLQNCWSMEQNMVSNDRRDVSWLIDASSFDKRYLDMKILGINEIYISDVKNLYICYAS